LLGNGIQYIHSIVENLYKKYDVSSYELHGIIQDPKSYVVVLRGGRYMYNYPRSGPRIKMGFIYLKMRITYTNAEEEPVIYVDLIKANENMLSGNEIINISKKIGEIIQAKYISLDDGSGLENVCSGHVFSLTSLYILSIGVSWYNTKGFVSPFFEIEREHNHRLLSLNIVDFLIAQREYTFKYLKDIQGVEDINKEKMRRMHKFINDMNSFFDFFEKYDKKYPFFEDIGLFLTREMSVQEFFTRIKLFILRVLPKNKTTIYNSLCSHLNWLFSIIDVEYIDGKKSEEEIQRQLSSLNPMVIAYDIVLIYNMKNPIIPTPLNYNIYHRKTARKRGSSGRSKKQKSTSKKASTRRRTYG
jgi:hypothetical protein